MSEGVAPACSHRRTFSLCQWRRIAGDRTPTQMPPRPPVKNSGGQKGQNDLFDQKGQMMPLTPGTLHWGHLHRHPAPHNPPPLPCALWHAYDHFHGITQRTADVVLCGRRRSTRPKASPVAYRTPDAADGTSAPINVPRTVDLPSRVWNELDQSGWIHNPVQSRRIWIGLDQKFTYSADSGLDWIQKCAMCIPYLET